jgi:DNA polymerase
MEELTKLEEGYRACQRCDLWRSRTQIVFGIGNPGATVLLLAERPGRQDDLTGLPFSGPSGDLLDRILKAPKVEIPKDDVYITNMVLCRAPDDRSPRASEIQACRERLHQQISFINPRLIVAMGRLPMIYFLGLKGKLEELRGWYETLVRGQRVPVFLTFNPASALYGQAWEIKQKKHRMYEDWKQIGERYRDLRAPEPKA